jgi:hypothetical protein
MPGTSYDTIDVSFIPPPEPFSLGNDTVLCSGQWFASIPSITDIITWQDGSHQDKFLADQSQEYAATIFNQCGTERDEIYVELDTNLIIPPIELTQELCPHESIELNVTQPFEVEYEWSTGSNLSAIEINTAGNYIVSISNNCISEVHEFKIIQGTTCDFVPDLFIPNVQSKWR